MSAVTIPVAVSQWIIDYTLAMIEILPPFYLREIDPSTELLRPVRVYFIWDTAIIWGLISDDEYLHPDKYTAAGEEFMELRIDEFFRYIG